MNQEKIYNLIEKFAEKNGIVGLGAVVVRREASSAFFVGEVSKNTGKRVTKESLFETGSLSKVFTALLVKMTLAKLGDTSFLKVSDLIPDLSFLGDITLQHLVTHTSGLPRLPSNLVPEDIRNPYKEYTERDLEFFLSSFVPEYPPGEAFLYSNLGYALIGYILEKKLGSTYGGLLEKNILGPLGMIQTYVKIPQDMLSLLTVGHKNDGKKAQSWDQGVFVGAGGIISNISDMEKFLQWNLSQEELAPGLMRKENIFWHNGMTGGYSSFMAFSLKKKIGLVILSNTAVPVDGLAQEILEYLDLMVEE